MPWAGTVPQVCTLGSMSGPSAVALSRAGSSASRSSAAMAWSGRNPVAAITASASTTRSWALDDVVALEVIAGQPDPVAGRLDGVDSEAADELDAAGLDQGGQVGGEPAPGGELVGLGAALADQRPRGGRADRPHDLGPGACCWSSARASRLVAAEWPAPTTTVRRPA